MPGKQGTKIVIQAWPQRGEWWRVGTHIVFAVLRVAKKWLCDSVSKLLLKER